MPYCRYCGIQTDRHAACPLCGTEIPGRDEDRPDYPQEIYLSRILQSADRKGLEQVVLLFLTSICFLAVIVITAIAIAAEWYRPAFWITIISIPAGLGCIMLILWLHRRPAVLIILEGLLALLYLYLLSRWLYFGEWLYSFAYPAVGVHAVLFLTAVYWWKQMADREVYSIITIVLTTAAASLLLLEVLLDRLLFGSIDLFWSPLAAVSLFGTIAFLQLLKRWALRNEFGQK